MTALRILVIEDEAMIGMLLSDFLSSLGYRAADRKSARVGGPAT
ncbi:MAG TPA: hypothetical protein VGC10_09055 [Sphingomonas sp.]